LYVPFTNGTTTVIYLVEVNKSTGYWTNVYSTAYDGTNGVDTKVGTISGNYTTLTATQNAASITVNGYTLADYAGDPTDNSSLYMDYLGNPLENHFWYVSYVVFSEAALHGDDAAGTTRYYHISIIDATNTVYFEVELYAPETFAEVTKNQTLYMTISENIYNDTTKTGTRQISGYLVANTDTNGNLVKDTDSNSHTYGLVLYTLRIKLKPLPKGYFYFYVDLPNGYVVSATTDMANQINTGSVPGSLEEGSFLPFTSIITKTIYLEFIVSAGSEDDSSVWAVTTSDIYTRKATYAGVTPEDTTGA
nr:hypothetical protein [Acholeplasmatales bacterium]